MHSAYILHDVILYHRKGYKVLEKGDEKMVTCIYLSVQCKGQNINKYVQLYIIIILTKNSHERHKSVHIINKLKHRIKQTNGP